MRDDHNGEPESYLEAVGILSRDENAPPAIVEELLKPELIDWVKSFRQNPIDMPDLHRVLHERLQNKVEKEGIGRARASLLLGMTEQSFGALVERGLPNFPLRRAANGEERFLKDDLDAFVSGYLPSFKTWGTRTSLLKDFHRYLESQTGFTPVPQPCEIGGCTELAAVICANADCQTPPPPRKICLAHREHLRMRQDESLCEECVRRVLYGDLKGRFQIAGTEKRLLRDHPNGR